MHFFRLTLPAVLAIFTVGFSMPASAQSVVLTIDLVQARAETPLGQDIQRQLDELEEELRANLQSGGEQLQGEIEDLQRQREEFIITDEVFEQRMLELQQQDQVLRARVELSGQAMQYARNRAVEVFFQTILAELSAIMEERGGTVLADRRSMILSSEETDITAEVIARVNARITELEVQLLPQQPPQE